MRKVSIVPCIKHLRFNIDLIKMAVTKVKHLSPIEARIIGELIDAPRAQVAAYYGRFDSYLRQISDIQGSLQRALTFGSEESYVERWQRTESKVARFEESTREFFGDDIGKKIERATSGCYTITPFGLREVRPVIGKPLNARVEDISERIVTSNGRYEIILKDELAMLDDLIEHTKDDIFRVPMARRQSRMIMPLRKLLAQVDEIIENGSARAAHAYFSGFVSLFSSFPSFLGDGDVGPMLTEMSSDRPDFSDLQDAMKSDTVPDYIELSKQPDAMELYDIMFSDYSGFLATEKAVVFPNAPKSAQNRITDLERRGVDIRSALELLRAYDRQDRSDGLTLMLNSPQYVQLYTRSHGRIPAADYVKFLQKYASVTPDGSSSTYFDKAVEIAQKSPKDLPSFIQHPESFDRAHQYRPCKPGNELTDARYPPGHEYHDAVVSAYTKLCRMGLAYRLRQVGEEKMHRVCVDVEELPDNILKLVFSDNGFFDVYKGVASVRLSARLSGISGKNGNTYGLVKELLLSKSH